MTTRKIIASVVHSASLSSDERAALLAPPVVPLGFCTMKVVNPAEHGESWCAWGQGQRSLFRDDTGTSSPITVIVPLEAAAPLSRAGYVLSS